MIDRLGSVPIFVTDQERALAFYRDTLGLEVVMDIPIGGSLRWIAVAPHKGGTELILFHPAIGGQRAEELANRVGAFTGIVLLTHDIHKTYAELCAQGVVFESEPVQQPWGGLETWFSDPDGNRFHLAQRPSWMYEEPSALSLDAMGQ